MGIGREKKKVAARWLAAVEYGETVEPLRRRWQKLPEIAKSAKRIAQPQPQKTPGAARSGEASAVARSYGRSARRRTGRMRLAGARGCIEITNGITATGRIRMTVVCLMLEQGKFAEQG